MLEDALQNKLWVNHSVGDDYEMDGKPKAWRIAYYPIFANGKNGEIYNEPRALVEQPMKEGIDLREVPLRYLEKK